MIPRINSFLMISAAGLPIFSLNSLTVTISVVRTAFSMTTGSGLCICCCFLLCLRPMGVSSSQVIFGAASFIILFLDFTRRSSSRRRLLALF